MVLPLETPPPLMPGYRVPSTLGGADCHSDLSENAHALPGMSRFHRPAPRLPAPDDHGHAAPVCFSVPATLRTGRGPGGGNLQVTHQDRQGQEPGLGPSPPGSDKRKGPTRRDRCHFPCPFESKTLGAGTLRQNTDAMSTKTQRSGEEPGTASSTGPGARSAPESAG